MNRQIFEKQIASYFIQIPAKSLIDQMQGMPTGGEEDQRQRLMNRGKTLEKAQSEHPFAFYYFRASECNKGMDSYRMY